MRSLTRGSKYWYPQQRNYLLLPDGPHLPFCYETVHHWNVILKYNSYQYEVKCAKGHKLCFDLLGPAVGIRLCFHKSTKPHDRLHYSITLT